MRLGLISDIHADLDNLNAALRLLRDNGAEQIICGGDLVERGEQGDAVVQCVSREVIPCVCGNHDEAVVGNQVWLRENGDRKNPNYQLRLLSDDTLIFLKNLPGRLNFEWAGRRVMLAHGTPWSNMQYLYPNSPHDLFNLVAEAAKVDVVVLGHTHIPMWVAVHETLIVNPGSVSADGSRTCAVLSLPEGSLEVFKIDTGSRVRASDFRSFRIE
jgi:putative phosphoesterase